MVTTEYDSRVFIERLLNNTLIKGQDSLLQEMFRNVVAETDNNSLSILVTDSIFSYPNREIRTNVGINRDNIAGLAADVQITFNDARISGKSASVLASKSRFHGTYFDYRNVRTKCCTSLRPYYVWLIGAPSYISAVRELMQEEGLHFDHEVDFNPNRFEPGAAVLQYTMPKGRWYRDRRLQNHIEKVTGPGSDDLQFSVALDLSPLTYDMAQRDFLTHHLKVQSADLRVKEISLHSRADFETSVERRDKAALPPYTHVIVIKTDNEFAKSANVSISIEDAMPAWYLDWSNDDDSAKDPRTLETTFGFSHFVEAVERSYHRGGSLGGTAIRLDR